MIEINNLTARRIDERYLKTTAAKILKEEKAKYGLSIALIGQKRIKELNKKYRKKNRPTDVLSFEPNKKLPFFSKKDEGLGEVVLCPVVIRENARKTSLPFKKELNRVLIHGILHLLGYSHENSAKEALKMRKKEEYYLSFVNF